MKINKTINITSTELNKYIKKMILSDMENNNIKQDTAYEGLVYQKQVINRMGKSTDVSICIDTLKDGEYKVLFHNAQGENYIHYIYEPVSDTSISLTYEEGFKAKTSSIGLNYMIMSLFTSRANKRRAQHLLNVIEDEIINTREYK